MHRYSLYVWAKTASEKSGWVYLDSYKMREPNNQELECLLRMEMDFRLLDHSAKKVLKMDEGMVWIDVTEQHVELLAILRKAPATYT